MAEINTNVNLEGNDGGEVVDQTGGNGGGTEPEVKEVSFDDFLKDPKNKSEFDRRVQEYIKNAVANAQKKWEAVTDDRVPEAEKLTQMTKEEKAEYKAAKLERELNELKRQNALNEMTRVARKTLAEEELNIPDDIISNLVSEDAEKTKEAVEAFAKSFKEAVQAGVKEALKGNAPRANQSNSGITKEQILDVKNRAERQKLMAENPELFVRR